MIFSIKSESNFERKSQRKSKKQIIIFEVALRKKFAMRLFSFYAIASTQEVNYY